MYLYLHSQNYGMRQILMMPPRTSSELLRGMLAWDQLTKRRSMLRLQLMYRCMHGLAPEYLCSYFQTNSTLPNHVRTRGWNNVHLYRPNADWHKKSFGYMGAKDWNSLPNELKSITSKQVVSDAFCNFIYTNLDYQFLCLHVAVPVCCFCVSIAACTSMLLVTLLYTFPFLGRMYMPVCMQDSLADQPHIFIKILWAEGTTCWKIKSTTTTTTTILSTSKDIFSFMLMGVCPRGTEWSVRETSLSFSSLCHSAWCCFKLGGRVGGKRWRKGEGKGVMGGNGERKRSMYNCSH